MGGNPSSGDNFFYWLTSSCDTKIRHNMDRHERFRGAPTGIAAPIRQSDQMMTTSNAEFDYVPLLYPVLEARFWFFFWRLDILLTHIYLADKPHATSGALEASHVFLEVHQTLTCFFIF